ncbi:tRNA (adenosine(37)-N6)-threonylcarbamoyltransferase complex ATPase subunit type 1 TsaE [Jiella sp. M17.18]|uniref:tRNA (adenosine(37)-N6)-threonylcarbamoyltransferase complex ATPase subunit type 1 TsaE n=1 Tax=Jiella sp. M17.18 TaxID=3234247 RepID=UPI0034DE96B0
MKAADTETCAGGGAAPEAATFEAEVILADTEATERLGADLALLLRPGDVVALEGDLGAGKSTLARAAVRAIADDAGLEVPSPTYTLVQSYDTTPPVAHFDLYRLGDASELSELGFEDAAESGVVLVEWPERAADVLAAANVRIQLATLPGGAGRIATITADGPAAARIARTLALRAFLVDAGLGTAARHRFTGDASPRRYETVDADDSKLVLMDAPRQPAGPVIRDGLPYTRIAHIAEDVVPFVALARTLHAAGFAVPAILRSDIEKGILLINHLGSGSVLDDAGRPIAARYEAAAECLAELHAFPWPQDIPVADGIVHTVPRFDRRAMQAEIDLLIDWFLPSRKGRKATGDERALFEEIWSELFDELASAETSLILRDVHSPNIIWRQQESGRARVGLIDFQDAMIGPSAYDLASLAQDARVNIPAELEASLVSTYIDRRRADRADFDAFGFERDYAIMATQRASKILGIFVRLCERDGKPQYLRHIPRLKTYLARTLGHPSLAALRSLYADWGVLDEDPGDA